MDNHYVVIRKHNANTMNGTFIGETFKQDIRYFSIQLCNISKSYNTLHSTNVLTVTMTIKAFHSFFDVWSWRCTTQGTNIYNIYNIYWPLHDICRARRQWTMQMTSNLRRTPSARAHPPGPARAPCVAQTGKIHI